MKVSMLSKSHKHEVPAGGDHIFWRSICFTSFSSAPSTTPARPLRCAAYDRAPIDDSDGVKAQLPWTSRSAARAVSLIFCIAYRASTGGHTQKGVW